MTRTGYARIGAGTAIAAVLAFSSTSGLAQEAQPTTTDTTSPVSATPAPTPDSAPAATDTASAPSTTDTSTSVATKTVKRTTHAVATKAKPVVTHTTTQTVTTHAAVPAAAAPVAATPASSPAPATSPTKVNPIVDVNAKSANSQTQPSVKATGNADETAMIAGGGALALLMLGGGAYALTRRRRAQEDAMMDEHEEVDEPGKMGRGDPIFEHEPPMVAPSAFAWGNAQTANPRATNKSDDRRPGETWVERAYRGPSADNPSLSLRKRLKRAAFFDKRDREVAAGEARPVDADAGLPENVTEPVEVRELEAA